MAAQRRPSTPGTHGTELEIRLTTEDPGGTPDQIRVLLTTSSGSIVADRYSGAAGNVTFSGLPSGNYRVKASGMEIEDSEISFYLDPTDQHHFENLQIKRKTSGTPSSNQGQVSAAELNIPEKAHKEFDKGLAKMEEKDFDEAEKHFTKATEIYPQYGAALNNLGVLAMRTGRDQEGKQFFQTAVQADPNNTGANVNFARCLIREGKLPEAEQFLQKASSISPLDAEPLAVLANAQMQAGQLDLALENTRKIHTLRHEHFTVAHLMAARILEMKGRPEEAAAEYRTYLKETPDSPKAADVRAALQSLENRVK
jgi:tetratricopeptide (TPR) repeat protein